MKSLIVCKMSKIFPHKHTSEYTITHNHTQNNSVCIIPLSFLKLLPKTKTNWLKWARVVGYFWLSSGASQVMSSPIKSSHHVHIAYSQTSSILWVMIRVIPYWPPLLWNHHIARELNLFYISKKKQTNEDHFCGIPGKPHRYDVILKAINRLSSFKKDQVYIIRLFQV